MCRLLSNKYTRPGMVELFRYDLIYPPTNWDSEYKSIEYVYGDEENPNVKNKIGAFFFYDSEAEAYNTGCIAANKTNTQTIWLTQTSIVKEITLLDISHFDNISSILLAFDDFGIDILNNRFCRYDSMYTHTSYCKLRPLLEDIKKLRDKDIKTDRDHQQILQIAKQIGSFFKNNSKIGYFGQLLTDFDNGISFKEILLEKGYDGYIFKESYTSKTYCIFDASALSHPVTKKIEL